MTADTPSAAPRFEPIDRSQCFLNPVDVEALIPEGHPARIFWTFVGELDLSGFAVNVKAVEHHAGRNRICPQLLIAIWLYAYSRGISSARQIERESEYEPGLQWLTGARGVNHHSLSDFRVEHGTALKELFVQVLGILSLKKLITLERVTVDGTKVRACVNKKTYSRESKIREHLAVARRHVEELQTEEAEQEKRGRRAAAQRRAARERVERLESALEEVQRLQAEKRHDKEKECQASTSDADAQFMRTGDHGVAPGYNVQLAVDGANKLVVGVTVSKQPSDSAHLEPMVEAVKENVAQYPEKVIADGDYTNRASVIGMADRGVDFYGSWQSQENQSQPYGIAKEYAAAEFRLDVERDELVCPEGKPLVRRGDRKLQGEALFQVYAAAREDCRECAARASCSPRNQMTNQGRAVLRLQEDARVVGYHQKMSTDEGKKIYRTRAPIAEFPHAWIKTKFNFVRLRCRGLVKATAEALWVCLAYNLQNYFRLTRAA